MRILAAIVAAWRRWKWARLSPGEQQVRRLVNEMTPEERAELDRELDTSAERESLVRAQAEHEAAQREIREERIRRAPEVQAAHAARMKAIADESCGEDARKSEAKRAKR